MTCRPDACRAGTQERRRVVELGLERMPAISDHNILPDMGRMTARLRSAASRGCSPAPIAVASGPRSCIR